MVREDLTKIMQDRFHKEIREADDKEIYLALMSYTKEKLKRLPEITGERKLYYISAEFLIGKLLSNNLINLGIYEEVAEVLRRWNRSRPLETAAWAGLPPVSWIPSPLWDFPETASD